MSLPDGIAGVQYYCYEKLCLEKHFIRDASAILLQRIFHILATAASRKYAALSSAHTWVFSAGFGGNVA